MSGSQTLRVLVLIGIAALWFAHSVGAFALFDYRWNVGQITMEMQLGSSGGPLLDGSADWDECAIAALAQWNRFLPGTGVNFNAVRGSTRTPSGNDRVNNVFFAADIFGEAFDSSVVAVATAWIIRRDGVDQRTESDVVFNSAKSFNCYRGALRRFGPGVGRTPDPTGIDLQRVMIHEAGHVLGLDHPDEHGQTVMAIMNSRVSNTDTIQTDDSNGVLTLYGVAITGIAFPPRDQVLTFFNELEAEYQNTLGRQRTNQGFVDAEGSAVWFPEWLRYVLNDCSTAQAQERVFLQIRGLGIQPVCGVVTAGVVGLPPRNQSLDFLNALDAFYRDELSRNVVLSLIDLEGKAVWLQEYLRYRVNGCDHQAGLDRVRQQIRGGAIASVCAG